MESILEQLCLKTIKLLDQLKADGKITDEEYQDHVNLKLQFLSNTISKKDNIL